MSQLPASPQHPSTNDLQAWPAFWEAQGQPWRTKPEIHASRQKELEKLLAVKPNEKTKTPFKNVQLSRADVEWLIAMDKQAKLADQNVGLEEYKHLTLSDADLRNIDLIDLPMEGADLNSAHLEGAFLDSAHLEGANLYSAHLEGANLNEAHLEWANLYSAHLEGAGLRIAHLEGADLNAAHLEGAVLDSAHLEGADLNTAHLEGANLYSAHLEGANLNAAHLEGANLYSAHLEGSDLRDAFFSSATNLREMVINDEKLGYASLAGVRWGDVDLSVVDWTQVKTLGDEYQAHQPKDYGRRKDAATRINEYRSAVRANRQLAVALQGQGLNEEAVNFAYRAQRLQRVVLRRQRKVGQYLFSLFLDLLAGYGYRPARCLIAYLLIIFGFMSLYLLNAQIATPHLRWDEALVLSVSSFHGRGFFSQNITLGDAYARLAAAEAVIGLLVEVSLIATFTQRFFGK